VRLRVQAGVSLSLAGIDAWRKRRSAVQHKAIDMRAAGATDRHRGGRELSDKVRARTVTK